MQICSTNAHTYIQTQQVWNYPTLNNIPFPSYLSLTVVWGAPAGGVWSSVPGQKRTTHQQLHGVRTIIKWTFVSTMPQTLFCTCVSLTSYLIPVCVCVKMCSSILPCFMSKVTMYVHECKFCSCIRFCVVNHFFIPSQPIHHLHVVYY